MTSWKGIQTALIVRALILQSATRQAIALHRRGTAGRDARMLFLATIGGAGGGAGERRKQEGGEWTVQLTQVLGQCMLWELHLGVYTLQLCVGLGVTTLGGNACQTQSYSFLPQVLVLVKFGIDC